MWMSATTVPVASRVTAMTPVCSTVQPLRPRATAATTIAAVTPFTPQSLTTNARPLQPNVPASSSWRGCGPEGLSLRFQIPARRWFWPASLSPRQLETERPTLGLPQRRPLRKFLPKSRDLSQGSRARPASGTGDAAWTSSSTRSGGSARASRRRPAQSRRASSVDRL